MSRTHRSDIPVAINARAAIRDEIGGVERVAREMARRLPARDPARYRVIAPRERLAHRAGHVWEQAALPLLASGSELIYSPANLAPVASRRNVIVIHDVAALRHPEAYSPPYVAYQRRLLPLLARRARLLITVSEFSRRELVEVIDAAPERVAVVPDGVDERFGAATDPEPARRTYRLTKPYVLAVGTSSQRKNLGALQTAARRLAGDGIELVVAGSDRGYLRGGESGLRRLGYVDEDLLPGVYAGALALVLPSLYEGFGLPCLEAMASGVPVVVSDRGALPETVGEAGLVVPASAGEDGFATALERVTADAELRAGLVAAGLERAAKFSWERTAELTDTAIGGLLT